MLEKIDTGHRKVLATCDLYKVMAAQPHHKIFKGPYADKEAETYVESRGLGSRAVIEAVMELPRTVLPAGVPLAELPQLSDENEEVLQLTSMLIKALKRKTTPDSNKLKGKYTTLHKLLGERIEQ